MSTTTLARLPGRKSHGHHIYAYCNIRTNQVLYSFERTLANSHLKQLADAGANNNPPKLRKDLWKPLFAVHLPPTIEGQRQGLELFRHLREYRMLHETNWELPEEITRPYTKKEIEEMQKDLDNRGGSKKETVFDVIKQKKKKMRQKMVMDQKANSIADLAHILLKQEMLGAERVKDKEAVSEDDKWRIMEEIQRLSRQFEEGHMAGLQEKNEKLSAEMREAKKTSQDKQFTVKQRKAAAQNFQALREQVKQVRLQIAKMEWSHKAMVEAKEQAEKDYQDQLEQEGKTGAGEENAEAEAVTAAAAASGETTTDTLKGTPQSPDATSAVSTETSDATSTTDSPTSEPKPLPDPVNYLPSFFPPHLDHVSAARQGAPFPETRPPKSLSKTLSIIRSPIFGVSDISIQWANFLDAEFAAEWPSSVKHEWMGFVRHSVPTKTMKVAEDVKTWKEQQWKGRNPNWAVENSTSQVGEGEAESGAADPIPQGRNLITPEAAKQNVKEDRKSFVEEIKTELLKEVRDGYNSQHSVQHFMAQIDQKREKARFEREEKARKVAEAKEAAERERREEEEMSKFVLEEIEREGRMEEEMSSFVAEEIGREERGEKLEGLNSSKEASRL